MMFAKYTVNVMCQLSIQIMKSLGHSENILPKMKNAGRREATVLGTEPPGPSQSLQEGLAHMKKHRCSFKLGIIFPKVKFLWILLSYQRFVFRQELLEI